MSWLCSTARGASLSLSGALSIALASGCIDGLVVDIQEVATQDAEVPAVDAAQPRPEPEGPHVVDAGSSPPAMDAGEPPMRLDAGSDAGHDAGSPVMQDAGEKHDAGCLGSRCDAGTTNPPGPCASCGVATLVQPANTDIICDNGAPSVCWTNPVGECTMQCPKTGSCTRDNPGVCGANRYCYFPNLDCGASTAGFCATMPNECSNANAQVCGCNGKLYPNTCEGAKDGSAVWTGLPSEHCR